MNTVTARKWKKIFAESEPEKAQNLGGGQQHLVQGNDGSHRHYHDSRYHCLNLHSVFQKGTIEFRLFNSTTHAGKVKTYIQFCLAISGQALNQTCAATRKTTSTNENIPFAHGFYDLA